MEKEELGIEETLDVFAFLDRLADEMKEAIEDDGKVSLPEMIEAAIQVSPSAVKAFAGMDQIQVEMKDLSEDELNQVVASALLTVQKIVAIAGAFKK